MARDYTGETAVHWRARYADFIHALRAQYPDAHIVCTTAVLEHGANWDRAIDEAVAECNDPQVTHFAYSRAGTGTPGHPRIAEDEEMARELCAYLESFGAELWER